MIFILIIESMYSKIIAVASAFPKNGYTNDEFIQKYKVDTTSEWIESMTGIRKRYFAENIEEFEEIVITSAKEAIEKAVNNIASHSSEFGIDGVIVASSSNSYKFPGLSQIVHKALGLNKFVRTIDINAACNGFMQALSIANSWIKFDGMRNVLVIGADAMSFMLNMEDRGTCCLFGDGAGAVVLSNENMPGGSRLIREWEHITLSENYESLIAQKCVVMNGRSVFENSIKTFEEIITKLLEKANKKIEDIDLLILHQANYRIFKSLCGKMGIDENKIPFLAFDCANTSAATIPIALSQVAYENKNLILAGFGAGFNASATLIS